MSTTEITITRVAQKPSRFGITGTSSDFVGKVWFSYDLDAKPELRVGDTVVVAFTSADQKVGMAFLNCARLLDLKGDGFEAPPVEDEADEYSCNGQPLVEERPGRLLCRNTLATGTGREQLTALVEEKTPEQTAYKDGLDLACEALAADPTIPAVAREAIRVLLDHRER